MNDFPDYEAARGYVDGTMEDVIGAVNTALGDELLYQEPVERCLHQGLTKKDRCVRCGAQQRWVVQVWPKEET